MANPETSLQMPSDGQYLELADVLRQQVPSAREQFLADVLGSRPPIPHGFADISDLIEEAKSATPTEAGYALERTVLFLATASEAYKGIGNLEIMTLDLCPSIPIYPQYLRNNEFSRDGARARDLAGLLYGDDALRSLRGDMGFLRPLAVAAAQDEPSRLLLESAIQEFLYTMTPADRASPRGKSTLLAQKLCAKLIGQEHVYEEDRAGTHVEGSGGLSISRRGDEDGLDYLESLRVLYVPTLQSLEARQKLREDYRSEKFQELARETLPVADKGVVELFIAWQARFLAQQIKDNPQRYKPARHMSMDSADPKAIALSSIVNMPEAARSRELYSHAVKSLFDPNQHITGNMFEELPFPDNSLALITCFDAWPAYFQTDEAIHGPDADFGQVALDALLNLYKKLAYGGKMVISPWGTLRDDYGDMKADKKVLDAVLTEFSTRTGQLAHVARASRPTYESWMSVADREIISEGQSQIFELRADAVDTLIINKPNEASYKSAQKTAAKRGLGSQVAKAETQG